MVVGCVYRPPDLSAEATATLTGAMAQAAQAAARKGEVLLVGGDVNARGFTGGAGAGDWARAQRPLPRGGGAAGRAALLALARDTDLAVVSGCMGRTAAESWTRIAPSGRDRAELDLVWGNACARGAIQDVVVENGVCTGALLRRGQGRALSDHRMVWATVVAAGSGGDAEDMTGPARRRAAWQGCSIKDREWFGGTLQEMQWLGELWLKVRAMKAEGVSATASCQQRVGGKAMVRAHPGLAHAA